MGDMTKNGGIGRVISILSNHMVDNQNLLVHILSFFNTGKNNFYYISDKITQNYLYDERINMKKAIILGGHLKLRRFLIDNKIDVLIVAGALFFPISILACKPTNIKCICWEHSNLKNNDVFFKRFCRLFAAYRADWIVVLTKRDFESYKKKYGISNICQIYNPIDPNIYKHEHAYKQSAKKIISVGRLCYAKNYEILIQIAKEVFRKIDDWEWHIYGEGELREKLETLIREADLEKRVKLKGQRNNIYELYSEYAFLVMTSRYEGFPMVLIEGLACGLPLVSFDIYTGPSEIIKNGENGYLIEKNNYREMANKIMKLINDLQMRKKMSDESKDISAKFNVSEIGLKWIDLLHKMVDEK